MTRIALTLPDIDGTQGTGMAHLCHRMRPLFLGRFPIYAGEPPCLHREAPVESGAPKGIRILIVLVTIGTRWDSLVQRSCDESQ